VLLADHAGSKELWSPLVHLTCANTFMPSLQIAEAPASMSVKACEASFTVKADIAKERDSISAKLMELHSNFGEYERKTAREIPVVALRKNTG
jgi:hypothetical protein